MVRAMRMKTLFAEKELHLRKTLSASLIVLWEETSSTSHSDNLDTLYDIDLTKPFELEEKCDFSQVKRANSNKCWHWLFPTSPFKFLGSYLNFDRGA
ncbi:MAG: hypothetical protein C0469_12395 [Cyanobacteria bacterium DS2.3.42]|nr:hypothetical protein [Cyanobacteria bacterium DS2.3.42]